MLSSSSSIVRSAIERAESRASVLNSLEKSYGNVSQSKVTKKKQSPLTSGQYGGGGGGGGGQRQVQSIQLFLGDQHERIRRALQDSLIGKSIVLTNLKSQVDASKSAKRVKRYIY